MIGPGKYDDACTAARVMTSAEVAILIVLGGDKGSGFHSGGINAKLTIETVTACSNPARCAAMPSE